MKLFMTKRFDVQTSVVVRTAKRRSRDSGSGAPNRIPATKIRKSDSKSNSSRHFPPPSAGYANGKPGFRKAEKPEQKSVRNVAKTKPKQQLKIRGKTEKKSDKNTLTLFKTGLEALFIHS